jgi:hypothetical protein
MNTRTNRTNKKLILLCGLGIALPAIQTHAALFNIDFGDGFGTPDATYGAAIGQTGSWNTITSAGPTALIDLGGNATTASVSCIAEHYDGFFGSGGINDRLAADNFYSTAPGSWKVSITGLENGTYNVSYYAPIHPSVDTGNFTINSTSVSSIPGSVDGALMPGVSWDVLHNVAVTDGTMTLSYIGGGVEYNGLAGMQISAVPEPASYALAFGAMCGIAALIRRRTFSH